MKASTYYALSMVSFGAMVVSTAACIVVSAFADAIMHSPKQWLLFFQWELPTAWAAIGIPLALCWAFSRAADSAAKKEQQLKRMIRITRA